jgi:hypothetical protein
VIDERDLEQAERVFAPPEGSFDRFLRYRNRKRRNQRITAGVVGIAVFVAAVWIVTSVSSLDRSETSVVPGGEVTGPAVETGPAVDGPAVTGPAETGGENPEPPPVVVPAPIPLVAPPPGGIVTRSGCALRIDTEPIRAGRDELTVLNDTNRVTSFDLFYLDTDVLTFSAFEEFISTGGLYGGVRFDPPAGASVLTTREVGPGSSATIVDNFASGETYAVVCAHSVDSFREAKRPFALVGPIIVP